MSSFDGTITPLGLNLAVDADEENPSIQIVVPFGTIIPIDLGNGQPLPVHVGTLRIPVPRALALDFAPKLQEEAEKLPEPKPKSDIVIPGGPVDDSSLGSIAEMESKLRGSPDS